MGYPGPRQKPVTVACDHCGGLITKHISHIRPRNYCNRECYRLALVGHVQSSATKTKRASKLAGALSPTWKGGQSRQFKRGYRSQRYKEWRTAVMTRDSYTCQDCDQHGGYLTAHHIKPFAQFAELRYEVSNGVTLCEPCHARRDRYFARLHPRATKGG